jgi:hypothetical protein
MIDKEASAN